MFNWNDVKYLLAVARSGSSLAAARSLNVDPATVQRRLGELERQLKLRLVERLPSGYRLTPAGSAVLEAAEAVGGAVDAFTQRCAEAAHAGTLRLTCPEPIADRLARSGFLARFAARYPHLRVEFVLADRYIDLSRGEADVALRSGDTDGALFGRKVADSLWAIYASTAYVAAYGAPRAISDLGEHGLIAFDTSLAGHRLNQWLDCIAPGARIVARGNSVLGLVAAARSGIGIAALPTALGDAETDLVQVLPPVADLQRSWRLLCHPDARHLERVSAFFDFVTSQIEELRPVLTG